jgi:hypothetical protein
VSFILDHQLALILAAFLLGVLGAALVYRRGRTALSWRIADLVWVVLGGFGGVTAVVTGLYESDRTRIDRQIDVAFVTAESFDRDAARFRLTWCESKEPPGIAAEIAILCEKVEFLSASTARNTDLPLFIEVARIDTPLRSLAIFLGSPDTGPDAPAYGEMRARIESFRPDDLLAFAAEDEATSASLAEIAAQGGMAGLVAEFRVLARSYEELIGEVRMLRDEWLLLEAGSRVLSLQVLALCLIAFAAPFRLGKSIAEIGSL